MADAAQANSIEQFIEGQAFLQSCHLAPPLSPVVKLDQQHTGRLGKGGNLPTAEGGGGWR
jgi:hypothetical protein